MSVLVCQLPNSTFGAPVIDNGIQRDDTFASSVFLSLGLDLDRWWAGTYGAAVGSKLYLLKRVKVTQQTLDLAETYAKESLQWMIDDEIATAIDVTASEEDTRITLLVDISLIGGGKWSSRYNAT